MAMDWMDVLFLHWTADADRLRALLPAGLELETFGGKAWVGVVPFRMSGTRPRFLPGMPGLSAFPELNARTYVRKGGISGVWFFSLDAANRLAVRGARRFFHLPYMDADMQVSHRDGEVVYASRRTHAGEPAAEFRARYAPTGPAYRAAQGSLDDWLTARYCFYAADAEGNLFRAYIHHKPWRLQPARCDLEVNTMLAPLGLDAGGKPPLLHYSERCEVVGWLPELLV